MMRMILLVLALAAGWAVRVEAQQPVVRTQLAPGGSVTVGEPVELRVGILVPTWMLGAPQFPVLDVEGAIVTGPGRTLNLTERRDGDTWAGVERAYTIVAVGPGTIDVPEITIPIRYSGEGAKPVDASVRTRAVSFEAVVPDEARGLPYFIASTRLTVRQTLDPRADTLKAGDALTRTVTVSANDAQAMLLPPLPIEPIDGLGVYAETPVVRDEGGERGSQRTGRRVDAVTYVMEQEGSYELPSFEVVWWDVRAKRVRRSSVEAVTIHVIPNPDAVAELPIPVEEDSTEVGSPAAPVDLRFLWWLLPALTGIIWVIRFVGRRIVPNVVAWFRMGEQARRESEAAYFAAIVRACRAGDAHAVMCSLTAWLNRIPAGGRLRTLDDIVAEAPDETLATELARLQQYLYGRSEGAESAWNGSALGQALTRYRQTRLRAGGVAGAEADLPALNPTG